jgi:hypothetical protein
LSTLPEQLDPLDAAASSPAEAPQIARAVAEDDDDAQTRHRIERSKSSPRS